MAHTKITLKTAKSLGEYIDLVIQESLKSALHHKALEEKDKQDAAAPDTDNQGGTDNSGGDAGGATDLFGDDNSGGGEGDEGDQGEEPQPSKTMSADQEKLKQGDVEAKDVIDKLNAIRSGKSFKDDKVNNAMDQYVSSLSKAERVALYAFLKGISQIVTGEVPGQQAEEPGERPADVEMEKGKKVKVKHIQPNVIKAAPPKQKVAGGQENTAAPVPITPTRK